MKKVEHLYRRVSSAMEYCYNIEVTKALTKKEMSILFWLLGETFEPFYLRQEPSFVSSAVREFGPRLNFATASNSNAISILHSCGLKKITRIEISRRIFLKPQAKPEKFYDRMTECMYPAPLTTFETGIKPVEVFDVPLMEEGMAAFDKIPGISMDDRDKQAYYGYFVVKCGRNPSIVEIMDLNNANSEHSRHGYFKGVQVIDGIRKEKTLMELIKAPWEANHDNSVVAFSDNSSAIRGYNIKTIIPVFPGECSYFSERTLNYHITFTAETHNFPSGIAPFPGAETGTGGRIRDGQATGRGSLVVAGTAGYCVGNLYLPDYRLLWEDPDLVYPSNLASPRDILIGASNGASDYGNKFGEPVIAGFVRAGAIFFNGERREWLKPIMFTGGIGQMSNVHLKKNNAEKGMLIIQIGGPAYRIGFGGGAASSLIQGAQASELDFNAVQRGDAEMAQKVNRVVRACVEMEEKNPIVSIHDQGAGGPANVLKELVEDAGGRIDIRKINVGDPTMSVLEIWVAEFQERNGLVIHKSDLERFQAICDREKVSCEVLGEVTGDGKFVVVDSWNGSTPVNLDLKDVLGGMPQKTFKSNHLEANPGALYSLSEMPVNAILEDVLRLPSICSKKFLTNKVDRSVTGLIAQQQCCGPLQLPVSDVAVIAQSHFPNEEGKYTGAATAIGEQPIKMLVYPTAGARMAVAEALTNLALAKVSNIKDIKCSVNWMGAPKLPGEGAIMYDAAEAMSAFMIELGIAPDGGKDSLSMATRVERAEGETEIVKSPLSMVVSAYCTVPDITKKVTPDIKAPGKSVIIRIDLSDGQRRLGGSALGQVYRNITGPCPNVKAEVLKDGFYLMQEFIEQGLILSAHDISDGGMIVSLLEMLFAGNCGFISHNLRTVAGIIPELFAEEAGWLIEVLHHDVDTVLSALHTMGVNSYVLGDTQLHQYVELNRFARPMAAIVLGETLFYLKDIWEDTSYQLELLQCDPDCVTEEQDNLSDSRGLMLSSVFSPGVTDSKWLAKTCKPKIAILREEGSNGDREMTSAFYQAGFEPFDVAMTHLLNGEADLGDFQGVAFVGGFSYADVLDSAKGWAGSILFNEKLKQMFDDFYNRPDTFSLGVCNGCQLSTLLGWVPQKGLDITKQPRFIKNKSGRFESRYLAVKILDSPAMMLKGMKGSVLGIWSAHGEGQFYCPDPSVLADINVNSLAPIRYADDGEDAGTPLYTEKYPFNPNGSKDGIAGICSADGRHLALMPHPERTFLSWQMAYAPGGTPDSGYSPWMKMFQNAREWCDENKV